MFNLSVPRATTESVRRDATKTLQPSDYAMLARMDEDKRRAWLRAEGFDPMAVIGNIARVAGEMIQAPQALLGLAQVGGQFVEEVARGVRDPEHPAYPPTGVAIAKGLWGAGREAVEEVRTRPGEYLQENPDMVLDIATAGLGAIPTAALALNKVSKAKKALRGTKAVKRAREMARLAKKYPPTGAARGPRPDTDLLGHMLDYERVGDLPTDSPLLKQFDDPSSMFGPTGNAQAASFDFSAMMNPNLARALERTPTATEMKKFKRWVRYEMSSIEERSRLDRAIRGDFSVDAFHGTSHDISSFDPGLRGKTTGAPSAREAFFFSGDSITPATYAQWSNDKRVKLFSEDEMDVLAKAGLAHNAPRRALLEFEEADKVAYLSRLWGGNSKGKQLAHLESRLRRTGPNDTEMIEVLNKLKERVLAMPFPSGPNIMPAKLKLTNPLVHDFEGASYTDRAYFDLLDQAKREGRDGAVFQNTKDSGPLTTVYAVFAPENIRSNNALFDPENFGSSDILASTVWPLGIGAAAAAYLANQKKEVK